MDDKNKEKWRLRGAVCAIFLLGFVAGIFFINAYQVWLSPPQPTNRQARFEQTMERLNLREDQKTQIREIFNFARTQMQTIRRENAPRVQDIRRQTDEQLQKVLEPKQWEQFQEIREESDRNENSGNNR